MSCSLLGLVEERMHHNNYLIRVYFLICPFMCLLGGDKAKKEKKEERKKRIFPEKLRVCYFFFRTEMNVIG